MRISFSNGKARYTIETNQGWRERAQRDDEIRSQFRKDSWDRYKYYPESTIDFARLDYAPERTFPCKSNS